MYFLQGSAICRNHGASVCSIKSKDENDYVHVHFCGCNDEPHWIGIHHVETSVKDNLFECYDDDGDKCYYENNKVNCKKMFKNTI